MSTVQYDSPAALNYLSVLQGIVTRMSTNSTNCKTWCITLLSAALMLSISAKKTELMAVVVLPLAILLLLDAYYLGSERRFRARYDRLVAKLHDAGAEVSELFVIDAGSGKEQLSETCRAIASVAIWPFYGLLAMVAVAIYCFIRGGGCG